jgi:hypothetical protein
MKQQNETFCKQNLFILVETNHCVLRVAARSCFLFTGPFSAAASASLNF